MFQDRVQNAYNCLAFFKFEILASARLMATLHQALFNRSRNLVLLPFLRVLNVLHDLTDVPRGRVLMVLGLGLVLSVASATRHHLVVLGSKVEVDFDSELLANTS